MRGSSRAAVLTVGGPPRVNLMPRAAIERRARAVHLRRWGWGLAATLAAVAVLGAGAFALQAAADQRLTHAHARTDSLIAELAALRPVSEKLALETELADFRSAAMATDVRWSRVLAVVADQLPSGIGIADFAFTPGAIPESDDPAAAVGADVTMVLTGSNPADIVDLVRTFRAVPGITEADAWSQTLADDLYRFDLRLTFDQSIYTRTFVGAE